MISGMKCSPVAPLKWWKSRPTSAATSRKIGALDAGPRGAEKVFRGTPASARLVSSTSRRDSFAAIGQQATGGKRRGSGTKRNHSPYLSHLTNHAPILVRGRNEVVAPTVWTIDPRALGRTGSGATATNQR